MSIAKAKPRSPISAQVVWSQSLILTLSGILIGTSLASQPASEFGITTLLAGLAGSVGYLSMRTAVRRRKRRDAESALRRAIRNLEIRIDRHIPRQGLLRRPRAAQRAQSSMQQYVSVVHGRGGW